jgi:hypothetical protein
VRETLSGTDTVDGNVILPDYKHSTETITLKVWSLISGSKVLTLELTVMDLSLFTVNNSELTYPDVPVSTWIPTTVSVRVVKHCVMSDKGIVYWRFENSFWMLIEHEGIRLRSEQVG